MESFTNTKLPKHNTLKQRTPAPRDIPDQEERREVNFSSGA